MALTRPGLALATLHLVRHGQTAWNAEGRLQGWIDVPLDPTGITQAGAVAARLGGHRVGAVISSDLTRASETAAAIATVHGLPVQEEAALRERRYGVMEGRLYAEGQAEYGARWQTLLRGVDGHFEGGESARQHYDRVAALMAALLAAPPAEEIVIVSHGGTVRRLYSYLRGGFSHEYRLPITNCSVMTMQARAGGSFARVSTG